MQVLIVGAGAVGQVYGFHLQRGGAEVSFYVRPRHVEALSQGLSLYPYNLRKGLRQPERMTGFGWVSDDAEVRAQTWDYVILCTHADSVLTPWFDTFAPAVRDAVFVCLHTDLAVRQAVAQHFKPARLIYGLIALISYLAPLPGEVASEPGIAFWIPPLTKIPFQGAKNIVDPLVAVFRRGGFPAQGQEFHGETGGDLVPDVVLSVFVLALEGAGWKFDRFLQPRQSALAKSAIFEMLEVQYRLRSLAPPRLTLLRLLLGRTLFRFILMSSRWVVPFNFEVYLRVHFSKIREQGRAGLAATLENARRFGMATPALQLISAQLGKASP